MGKVKSWPSCVTGHTICTSCFFRLKFPSLPSNKHLIFSKPLSLLLFLGSIKKRMVKGIPDSVTYNIKKAISSLFIVSSKNLPAIRQLVTMLKGFPGGSVLKLLPANTGNTGSIRGLGRSPGGGNGNPFQDSCLGNLMDRGTWQATVHRVAKSWT